MVKFIRNQSQRVLPKAVDMNKKAFELGRGC